MELTGYFRIIRQRWKLVALPCLAALLVAALTLPEEEQAGPVVTNFTATATLITSPTSAVSTTQLSLATVALFATTGEIPERTAKLLDFPGEPQVLASLVTVAPDSETSTLTISSSDPDGAAAEDRVNAFAEATISFFRDQLVEQNRLRIQVLERDLARTGRELTSLRNQLTKDPENPVLQARVEAYQSQYSSQFAERSDLQPSTQPDLLTMLQPGVAIPQSTQTFSAPSNPATRIGIAGLLGLLLGAALALVVERLDSRMRTREQVEDAAGLPVLAEIPVMPKNVRSGVVSATRPASVVAEAFRSLRSSVLLLSPGLSGAAPKKGAGASAMTILVTSALPREGKTTTVTNLAAVMAEAGRRVLLLSLDLRNPRLHLMLDVDNGSGVSDLLAADRGHELEQVVRNTDLAGVTIATSGHHMDHPGALLASVGPLIKAARSLADIVLIDTPPLLTVSDALDVARHADVTLVVSRLNKTTRGQAEECHRLLSRLGIPALGTVLVGSRPAGARYGYPMPVSDRVASTEPDETGSLARDGD